MSYRYTSLRKIVRVKQFINKYWNTHSGEWAWLQEKPLPVQVLNRSLWKVSVPSFTFYFLLALSSVISTLGLLADSAATIIGAMIIAPMMGPIIGVAYSMVVNNRRLLIRSSLTLLKGIIMVIFVSMLIAILIGLKTVRPEVTARAYPTLIDLGVALAAGAAGAYAKCRRKVADALPGVAISVALVPPLSVVGIGLAIPDYEVSKGAFLLFTTNLAGIIFSGGLVLLFLRYGSLDKAKNGLLIAVLTLIILGLPLGYQFESLLLKENSRSQVEALIRNETVTFKDKDIRSIQVQTLKDRLFVEVNVEVGTDLDDISEQQVSLVRDFLESELSRQINLKVRLIPSKIIDVKVMAP
ncbi:MAG: TIGR00341 family protein [Cyanobacteriota bacterium]|nr:TIGR00341 family protein [Cyanobacteriota bacterium]